MIKSFKLLCLSVFATFTGFVDIYGQGVNPAAGQWLRVRVARDGMYRLSGRELREAGLSISGKDPRKLAVYTHQGRMLSEQNVAAFHGTREMRVWVEGEGDGTFDDNDYLLFYGAAPHTWTYNGSTWRHRLNFYGDYTYFYIGFQNANGLRVSRNAFTPGPADQVIDRTEVLAYHEQELENPNHMGRTWVGEKMGNETLTRTVNLTMPTAASDSFLVRLSVAGGMVDAGGSVNATVNGQPLGFSFGPLVTDFVSFEQQEKAISIVSASRVINAQFTLNRPNSKSNSWVDYIEVLGWMPISLTSDPLMVRNRNLGKGLNAEIRGYGNNLELWNLSDPMNPVAYEMAVDGSFQKALLPAGVEKQLLSVFSHAGAWRPEITGIYSDPGVVISQPADLLIITHPRFRKAADQLAALRRQNQGYEVQVTEVQQIYNQYSTSQQDVVAIRDYVRALYRFSQSTSHPLRYVLLMGAASYDMKDRLPGNTNYVPTYEFDSPNKGATFSLDDFYGYLDSLAGDPARGDSKMQVSVGRIPCRTEEEALGMVLKLSRYDSPQSLGEWRTNINFVCDDVDLSWETIFTSESEKYARYIDTNHRYLYVNKTFMDAYKQVSTGNTEKYPDVNAAVNRSMQNGCLFMNYQGHGGPAGWAQESILDIPGIKAWNNTWRMPVMFTATCEFSLYDDPKEQSGGELALLNPSGGPIALMSTTRLVFVSGNMAINSAFWTNYGFPQPNEPIPTLGELFRRLKNRPTITSEDNKFALLGDPSMPVAFPKHIVQLDSVNGKAAAGFTDTLKAFSVVTMKGHIEERLKGPFTSFNGNLWVRVYDKAQLRKTLVNDGIGSPIPFEDQSSFIYKGVVSVVNGTFKVVFTVPKDIAYNVDFGKVLFYAHNGVTDAAGGARIRVGSSESSLIVDNDGPLVKAYINDSSFVSGGEAQPDALIYARVSDRNGLNSTGAGIGRDMIAILDEGTADEQSFIVNDYFTYDLNSYTSGTISMPVTGLAEGRHTLRVRVWDIYNNSGEDVIEFVVTGNKLRVTGHYAFPNPFREQLGIAFTHNMPGSDLTAEARIVDLQGREMSSWKEEIRESSATETRLTWPGVSVFGNGTTSATLPAGVYIYQVKISAGSKTTTFAGRLIKY